MTCEKKEKSSLFGVNLKGKPGSILGCHHHDLLCRVVAFDSLQSKNDWKSTQDWNSKKCFVVFEVCECGSCQSSYTLVWDNSQIWLVTGAILNQVKVCADYRLKQQGRVGKGSLDVLLGPDWAEIIQTLMDSKAAAADANIDISYGAIKSADYLCLQRQCAAMQKSVWLL